MTDPLDRRDDTEFARLSNEVERLTRSTGSLTDALTAIEVIQRRQIELESRQADTESRVEDVARTERVRRRAVMRKVYGVGVFAVAGLLTIGVVGANITDASRQRQYDQCVASLKGTAAVRQFLDDEERYASVPAIRDSARKVNALFAPLDCKKVRG